MAASVRHGGRAATGRQQSGRAQISCPRGSWARWRRQAPAWRAGQTRALLSVRGLFGGEASDSREPEAVLRELATLELEYLFPVAGGPPIPVLV